MQSNIVLGYWNIRGRAQPIRLLLEYLEVKYTEKRYKDPIEWFEKDKHALNLDFPNLPYLIEDTKKITETFTIMRYLCIKHNRRDLLGRTDDHDIKLSTLQGVLSDLINDTYSLCCDDSFYQTKDEFFLSKLRPKLSGFSKMLGLNDFLIGQLSYLDFVLFEMIEMFLRINDAWLEDFWNLLGLHKRMKQISEIKRYLASSRFIEKPFLLPDLAIWNGS